MLQVEAPAKLTLRLAVVGQRSDGYHFIDAEMVALSLADSLLIDRTVDTVEVEMYPEPLAGPPDRYRVPSGESNSVVRTLAFLNAVGSVVVTKRIPQGAGLGGGTSDAAAVLRAFDYEGALANLAALGADIAPSFVGGHVRVQGIGEVVEALDDHRASYVLFIPDFSIETKAVYRALDFVGASGGFNDLFGAACAVEPRLGMLVDDLEQRFGRAVMLAGSGSTVFCASTFEDLGLVATQTKLSLRASTVRTIVGSVVAIECCAVGRGGHYR